MGEAGSLAASPGPGNQSQPSDPETHGPVLLCLPMELLQLIIEKLPIRSLPNVRLVCRKLESVTEIAFVRLYICVEAQPRAPETHPIFRSSRQGRAQAAEARHATAYDGRSQLAFNGGPPVAPQPPGWAPYVRKLHLSLCTGPQPEPQPQLARRQTDIHGHGGGGGGGVHPDDVDMIAAGAPAAGGVGAAAGGQELLQQALQQAQALMAAAGLQPVALPPPPLWQDAVAAPGEVPAGLLQQLLPPAALPQEAAAQPEQPQPVGPAAAGAAAQPHEGEQQPPGAAAAPAEPDAGAGAAPGGGAGHQAPAAAAAAAIAGLMELMQQAHAAFQLQQQPQGQQEQEQPLQYQQQGQAAAEAAAVQGAADTAAAAGAADDAVGQQRNAPAGGADGAGSSRSVVPAAAAAAAAAAAGTARASLSPAQAEAVLNARLAALKDNLMPHLRSLDVLSLDQVPRGCMAAAGHLLAAASALKELRVVRVDPPEAEEPPALQNQLDLNQEMQQQWHGIVAAEQGLAHDDEAGNAAAAAATAGHAAAAAGGQVVYLGHEEEGEERGGEEEEEGKGRPLDGGDEVHARSLGHAAAATPAPAAPEAAIGDAAAQEQQRRPWRQGEAGSTRAGGVTAAAADPAGPGPSSGVWAAAASDTSKTSAGAVGGGGVGGGVSATAAADASAAAAAVRPSVSGTLSAADGGRGGAAEDADEDDAAASAPDFRDLGANGGDGLGGGAGGGGGGGAATAPDAAVVDAGADGDRVFWSRVASLPRLQTLVLRGGALAGADMEGLMALTGLQQLEVNHVVNMHPGLACLASLAGLTRLVIEDLQYVGGAINDEFCGLSQLTGLRSLSFLVVGPLPAEVLAWGALTLLTRLEITNHYDDNLLPCFSSVLPRLPHLCALNLSNFDINNSLLIALRPCAHLSSLQMGRFNLSHPCAELMPAVRQLHLGFVDDLQHTEVPLVAVFPSLEDLALQTRYVLSHDSAQRIPRELLPRGSGQRPLQVAQLHLYDALMSKQVPLALPGLTCLRLDWNQTETDLLVSYMSEWGGSLRQLAWVHCDGMRDDGLAAMAVGLPRLRELELVRCVGVTDGGLVALAALTALTSLTVAGAHQLTAAGFTPVVSALPLLERLTLRDMPGLAPEAATELERRGNPRRRGELLVELLP